MTVFPVPPFGENTVTIRPRRVVALLEGAGAERRPAGLADGEDDVLRHLREEQHVRDVRLQGLLEEDGGLPEASRMIGVRVCSRMEAISSAGSVELRVPWRITQVPSGEVPADSDTDTLVPTSSISP